jgi:hypothetical protein
VLVGFTRELSAAGRACRIVGALPATRRLISMANLADHLHLDGVPDGCPGAAAGRPADAAAPARRPVSGHPVPVRGALARAGR